MNQSAKQIEEFDFGELEEHLVLKTLSQSNLGELSFEAVYFDNLEKKTQG